MRGLLGGALLLLALLVTLAVQLFSTDTVVPDADLAAAAKLLSEQGSGQVVVVHPPWREDLVAALRGHLPDRDIRLAAPVRDGLPTGQLALVEAGWSPGPGAFSGLRPLASQQVGSLALSFYDAGGAATAAKAQGGRSLLLDDLKKLQARFERGSQTIVCDQFDPAGPRYDCPPLPEWNHIAATTQTLAGKPQRCLWAHPLTDGTLVIEAPWPRGARELAVYHGLSDHAAAASAGKPVTLEVLADAQPLKRYVQQNQQGYTRHLLQVDPDSDAPHLVLMVTPPSDGARHFCIDLRVGGGAN